MIVIASKDGIIPINRGALFDSFVRALLLRERLNQIDINSIIDILSELAFYLKKEGMVSVPKEKAEKLIIDRIKSTHDNHSPYDLLSKVNVCNIISITANTSFIHEAFLDYFCAVKVKINFNILFNSETINFEDIGINNVIEPIWYEPLIMCGDLFRKKEEEKQAENYFELLFKGILQKNHTSKRIERLSKEDWNENLNISCKVAYNQKNAFPSIYSKAEMYLSNYMTLWLYNYRKSLEIIPLENLFIGISSLSSPKLLEKLFFDVNWQEVWLYNPSDDPEEKNPVENKYVFENSDKLSSALVTNISDFECFCKILFNNKEINRIIFFKIVNRISEVKYLLFRNTSTINLKNIFLKRTKDLNLLKFISYLDLDFFITNYQIELWGYNQYAKQLGKIMPNENARKELVRIFDQVDERRQSKILIGFLKLNYSVEVFDILAKRIDNSTLSQSQFQRIKKHLKTIPYDSIPQNIQKYFFKNINVFYADYEIVESEITYNIADVLLSNIYNEGLILNDTKIIINNSIIGIIISSRKYNRQVYLKINFIPEVDMNILEKHGHLKSYNTSYQIIDECHPDVMIEYFNLFKLNNYELKQEEIALIIGLGLTHKFLDKIPVINFAIVLSIYNKTISAYSLLSKTFTMISVPNDKTKSLAVNQIIVIEKNNKIGIIKLEEEKNVNIHYLIDEIIRIDYEKKEGHIRKNNKMNPSEKDFYFHFNDCNFFPHLGDIVSFIPAINIYPKSFGSPKSYNIRQVSCVRKGVITKLNYDGNTFDLYGFAIDKESEEEMSFTVRKTSQLLAHDLKCGDIFTYRTLSYPLDNKIRFIKLLEKVK